MKPRRVLLGAALLVWSGVLSLVAFFEGCSTQGGGATDGGGSDGAGDAISGSLDAAAGDADAGLGPDSSRPSDAGLLDSIAVDSAANDADGSAATVTALAIASADGTPLQGSPGDAVPLVVVLTMSDGTTRQASASDVTWLVPATLAAEDPEDAGGNILPEAGILPAAFYVRNDYRQVTPGALFILDQGSLSSPHVTVTASIADAGQVSASVAILPPHLGDPDGGEQLFQHVLLCSGCHGPTGAGSPPALLPDGGAILFDGGPAYLIAGQLYPYPAPGLNAAPGSGNLAADPEWNAALFSIAAQSDMDNMGVALRLPMPAWGGGNNGINGQSFADIYAWLQTQTQ